MQLNLKQVRNDKFKTIELPNAMKFKEPAISEPVIFLNEQS